MDIIAKISEELQLKEDVKNAGKVDDVTVGGVSVVENKVAKIPAIPKSNVIINRISLSGIQGDPSFKTQTNRDVVLIISADTPLPIDKFIGVILSITPEGESESHIQALIIPAYIAVTTDSVGSETLVYGFSSSFRAMASSLTGTNPNGTQMSNLNTASISVSIITDGVIVSLDKTKSQLIGQS